VTGAIRFAAKIEKTGAMRRQTGMLNDNCTRLRRERFILPLDSGRLMGDPFDFMILLHYCKT
jgi:hypothetical protein